MQAYGKVANPGGNSPTGKLLEWVVEKRWPLKQTIYRRDTTTDGCNVVETIPTIRGRVPLKAGKVPIKNQYVTTDEWGWKAIASYDDVLRACEMADIFQRSETVVLRVVNRDTGQVARTFRRSS